MKIFGEEFDARELKKYFGDMSQIAGIRRCIISEGRATGTDAFDVKTGSGLVYTVLPGRGMDIADASYKGVPLSFISKTGIVSPQYYMSEKTGFLRNFFGGLLTTCGLMNAGPQCELDGEIYRMHGYISNIPAYNVGYQCFWKDDEYELMMQGTVRESRLFGENLTLKRTVVSYLGKNVIKIHDVITNEGFDDMPFMLLYHMNLGYPVVSEHSHLITPSVDVVARDEDARKGIDNWDKMDRPIHGYREQVFFHELASDSEGNTLYGVVNEKLLIGVYFRINKRQLPHLTQWKMMGEQDYTLGLEPGVNIPEGRLSASDNGHLKVLKPQQEYTVDIEFGVLDGPDDIEGFKQKVRDLIAQ